MAKRTLSQDAWSQLMATLLTNIDPGQLDPEMVQVAIGTPQQTGRAMQAFINAGCRMPPGAPPILNFDIDPFIPEGWSIHPEDQIASRLTGSWELDLGKIGLHLDTGQQDGKDIVGHELKRSLESQQVLPAHVLDYLLVHPELIPESWKGKDIFFWGTVYRKSVGYLYVHFLFWSSGKWRWDSFRLGSPWYDRHPCAVLAS